MLMRFLANLEHCALEVSAVFCVGLKVVSGCSISVVYLCGVEMFVGV